MVTLTLTDDMEQRLESLGANNSTAKERVALLVLAQALGDLTALETQLHSEIEAAFEEGPARPWGDAEWEALLRGEHRHRVEEGSTAAPPGWAAQRVPRDE